MYICEKKKKKTIDVSRHWKTRSFIILASAVCGWNDVRQTRVACAYRVRSLSYETIVVKNNCFFCNPNASTKFLTIFFSPVIERVDIYVRIRSRNFLREKFSIFQLCVHRIVIGVWSAILICHRKECLSRKRFLFYPSDRVSTESFAQHAARCGLR